MKKGVPLRPYSKTKKKVIRKKKLIPAPKSIPDDLYPPISKPYIINIENTTDEPKKAVLFGRDRYLFAPNFGSDEGIEISCEFGAYSHLLDLSVNNPFDVGQWRISLMRKPMTLEFEGKINQDRLEELIRLLGDDISDYIPSQNLLVTFFDVNSKRSASEPVDLILDPYQVDKRHVVLHYPAKISGGTMVEFVLAPKRKIQLRVYPRTMSVPERPKSKK